MIQLLLKDLKHNQRKEAGLKMGHDAILIKGRIFEDFLVNFIQLISLIASNANRQPSLPKANTFRNSFSFFSDCVVIIFLSKSIVKMPVSRRPQPAVCTDGEFVQSIFKYDFPFQRLQRLLFIFIPLKMEKDNGISSASINRPICTIGFGRCSLDIPYLRKR